MTKQIITPHLWYDKEAKEAAEFYVSAFGQSSKMKNVSTIHDTPSGSADIVTFEILGQEFMAISAGPFFKINPSISFVPEAEQCGWVKDKYGVSWQIIPENMGELMSKNLEKTTPVMLDMKKIIIEDLKQAGEGK